MITAASVYAREALRAAEMIVSIIFLTRRDARMFNMKKEEEEEKLNEDSDEAIL